MPRVFQEDTNWLSREQILPKEWDYTRCIQKLTITDNEEGPALPLPNIFLSEEKDKSRENNETRVFFPG